MSVRAMSRGHCEQHGEVITHWGTCIHCTPVRPVQLTDNTTRHARTQRQRNRDIARMRAARAAKRAAQAGAL